MTYSCLPSHSPTLLVCVAPACAACVNESTPKEPQLQYQGRLLLLRVLIVLVRPGVATTAKLPPLSSSTWTPSGASCQISQRRRRTPAKLFIGHAPIPYLTTYYRLMPRSL
jgi:hypothetical protein